jgi:hypothetical protein
MAYVDPTTKAQGALITDTIWNQDVQANVTALAEGEILITLDGSGAVLSTGIVARLYLTHAYTIQQVTLGANAAGSVVVDIWKDVHANYPPTVADTITAAAKPTLSAATTYQDGTLTGWTTAIAAGDWLFFNIDSVATITYLTIVLKIKRSG